MDPKRLLHLVDRDALALEYTRQNVVLNHLSPVKVYGSLGYDSVEVRDFDLILSNIPAKAGEQVISSFLLGAQGVLGPGGLVAIVVVSPLAWMAQRILDDPAIGVVFRKEWPGHTVLHYRFRESLEPVWADASASGRGIYDRAGITVATDRLQFPMQTAWGLAEFDTLSYHSELLIDALLGFEAVVENALVYNPGQGHSAVALWQLFKPHHITLIDRDRLGLSYTRKNLVLNGCPAGQILLSHQVGLSGGSGEPADLIVGVLREGEGPEAAVVTLRQAAGRLAPDGTILLAASSTAATRLVQVLAGEKFLRVEKRKRSRGVSLLHLRPPC
jgi:16S rRNA G1207 methylase RsmC